MIRFNPSLLVALALGYSGCTVGPDYEKPTISVPDTYRGNATATSDSLSSIDLEWWKQFKDPNLNAYVQKALQNNLDIAASEAQLEAYLAQFDQTESYLYPHINGSASVDKKSTENAIPNRFYREGILTTYGASLAMTSYEIDFYGKVRRTTEGARAMLMGSEYNRRMVALGITASVCHSYSRLSSLKEQIALAQNNLAASVDIEKNTLLKYQVGAVSETDWLSSSAQADNAKATLSQLEAAYSAEEATFCTLLGENVHSLSLSPIASIHVPSVPAGLPSQLLTRRPDVAQAEQNLIMANAAIGIKKAAYFPNISLTAMLGVQSATLSTLTSDPTRLWQVTPVASIPLFTAGLIGAQVAQAKADYNQSLAQYRKSVLNALNETDNAISQNAKASEQLTYLQRRSEMMRKGFEQAKLRYRIGSISYTDFLIVQQNWNAAEQQALIAKQNLLTTTIGLYKALGGGWDDLKYDHRDGNN